MKQIEKIRHLFIDVSPIERLLEFSTPYYPVVSEVLDIVYEKKIKMIVSSMTLHRVAFKAFSTQNDVLVRQYREFFTRSDLLYLREVDSDIALKAAEFQAKFSLDVEESIQLATAFWSGADGVLTEKQEWKNYLDVSVITLQDLLALN